MCVDVYCIEIVDEYCDVLVVWCLQDCVDDCCFVCVEIIVDYCEVDWCMCSCFGCIGVCIYCGDWNMCLLSMVFYIVSFLRWVGVYIDGLLLSIVKFVNLLILMLLMR